jgi:DNA invertase Pin-like site-specific DNA recombinase
MFQMPGTFAEFERAIIRERVLAGMARAKGTKSGNPIGRPPVHPARRAAIREAYEAGEACEPLPHSSVLVSRPFAAASIVRGASGRRWLQV